MANEPPDDESRRRREDPAAYLAERRKRRPVRPAFDPGDYRDPSHDFNSGPVRRALAKPDTSDEPPARYIDRVDPESLRREVAPPIARPPVVDESGPADLAELSKEFRINAMAELGDQYAVAIEGDSRQEIDRNIALMVSSAYVVVRGQIPRGEPGPFDDGWKNPYNADTPVAAEARLEAVQQVQETAHNIGKIIALQEIEKGNISQRRAAALLHVAQMTVNRWYREYQAQKPPASTD